MKLVLGTIVKYNTVHHSHISSVLSVMAESARACFVSLNFLEEEAGDFALNFYFSRSYTSCLVWYSIFSISSSWPWLFYSLPLPRTMLWRKLSNLIAPRRQDAIHDIRNITVDVNRKSVLRQSWQMEARQIQNWKIVQLAASVNYFQVVRFIPN